MSRRGGKEGSESRSGSGQPLGPGGAQKTTINIYESGLGVSKSGIAMPSKAKSSILGSETNLNKSIDQKTKPKKSLPEPPALQLSKPGPKGGQTVNQRVSKMVTDAKKSVKEILKQSGYLGRGLKPFENTNDTLRSEVSRIKKDSRHTRETRGPPRKREPQDVMPREFQSEAKVVNKVPARSPQRSVSNIYKQSSSSSSSSEEQKSFVDAKQIKRNFMESMSRANEGREVRRGHANSSVPANKGGGGAPDFEPRINPASFNMSGRVKDITPKEEPQRQLLSREEVFRLSESRTISDLITLIRDGFKEYPSKKFKTTLSFYEMTKMLGTGSYGKVYEGIHKLSGARVAMKTIEKTTIKNYQAMEKLFTEIDILGNLAHPNVVRLLEIFENEKYYFLVTEFAEKGDLHRLLDNNGCFSIEQTFIILRDLVQVLEYLREAGVLHRDIKLDNILLDSRFKTMLCDFGVSVRIRPDQSLQERCGTLAYMPPEAIRGSYEGFSFDVD